MAVDNIFRISSDTEMTEAVLLKYIKKNDDLLESRYRELWDAYNNDYPIYHKDAKAEWKPDHRVSANFAAYIVDMFEGFFLGNPIVTTSEDHATSDYVNYLDAYNDQDDRNAELSRIVSIFGRGYEIYYTDEEGVECTAVLDPMDSFMIFSDGINPRPMYFVRTYVDENNKRHGSISDAYTVRYFDLEGEVKFTEEEYHGFADVPATEFIQNRARRGVFENVLPLINEFNEALSEKCNDVSYFADAYMKVLGAAIDEKTIEFMRDNRIINFGGKSAKDLDIDFLQKPNGDKTQENLLNRLTKLIFETAMIVNMQDDDFATQSGIALQYRLIPMLNLFKTKERKFTSGLNRRYKVLFSNPVSNVGEESWIGLQYKFSPNIPEDIATEAEAVNALDGQVTDETKLKVLSIVDDPSAEVRKVNEQKAAEDDTDNEDEEPDND